MKRLVAFLKSIWIARDLKSRQVDMIHTHFAWLSAAAGWVAGSLLNIPFTVTTHAYDIYSSQNDLLPLTTRNSARVITISRRNKQAMQETVPGLPGEKIQVIHCGVDLAFFKQPEIQTGPLHTPLQITSVGSLIEKKGHEYLIRACSILKQQGIPFHCVIIGTGELEQELERLIHSLGLDGLVLLAGKRSQDWVKERLAQSGVFILACVRTSSSDQDGIPVAMMESLAMGVPVISTAVSGIPEMITHEVTGLLVDERDPEGLAQAVIRLTQDAGLSENLRQQGRALVEEEYNITTNVQVLSGVFAQVVAEKGSRSKG